MFRRPVRDLTVITASLMAIAATTVLLRLLPSVSPATVAVCLLLIVVGAATQARLRTAIVVSVAAMLAMNFFFLPPIGRFTIADPQNWIALFAFLAVAIVASNLSAAAQQRAHEAIARRNEVTRLFDLTRDVLLTTETAGAIDALARHIARRFGLSRVAIYLPDGPGWRSHQGGADDIVIDPAALKEEVARACGTADVDRRTRPHGGRLRVGEHHDVSIVALRHGTHVIGMLAASPALDIGTLDAVAGVAAIAIERAYFLGEREAAELIRQKADLAATLLASLSHDLRTPLTAIKVAVENLNDDLPPAVRLTQARAAMSELDRLTRLFEDILDMARIDSAAIHVDRQWVAADDVIDAALAYVRPALEGRPLKVDTGGGDMEVEIDPKLVSAALSHILENAAQYSPPDRTIVLEAKVTPDGLYVSVTDQGPGLDPAELDHLFERFYRGRTAREASYGTGMGLSITRGLLAAAGGHVWAENAPDAGAKFSMTVSGPVRIAALTP